MLEKGTSLMLEGGTSLMLEGGTAITLAFPGEDIWLG